MPGLFRCTCGDYARVLHLISHARLRVHWAPGFPCALCYRGRGCLHSPGAILPRKCGRMSRRHCEEQRDEAIHSSLCRVLDCFASLAMTALKKSELKRKASAFRITSPRLRGDVGAQRRVRGTLRESECVESPPHPNPLPASGVREPSRPAAIFGYA